MKTYIKCKRCGRRLNDPASIKAELGPTCAHIISLINMNQDHGPLFSKADINDVLTDKEKKEGVIL